MQHLDEGTIHAWLDGELLPAEAEAAEAHIAACDECKAAVAEARGFIAASSRILMALDAVPGGVLPASGTSATARKTRGGSRFVISRAWMAAAAVLVISTVSVIALRPRRDAAIAMVAARDEATSLRADTHSAPSAGASAPTVAAAPEPSPAPSEKATNASAARAEGKVAPSDEKDVLRKKVERAPMMVAQAPASPASENAKPAAAQAGDAGAGVPTRMRAMDAMAAKAPEPAAAPALVAPRFADSSATMSYRRNSVIVGDIPITGRVLSDAGAPLGTASVTLEGTGVVTLTRDDGSYAMTVPASRVDGKTKSLVARLIGYKAATVPIAPAGDPITHDFVLHANPLRLGEVVITGNQITSTPEKLGSSINTVDSARDSAPAASAIGIRGIKSMSNGTRAGLTLANGVFAEVIARTSSGESGEPVDITLYGVGDRVISFTDRLRPDTTKSTIDAPFVAQVEREFDKQHAKINTLAWTDAQGRMRTLRGPVSLQLLQRLKQALDTPTP